MAIAPLIIHIRALGAAALARTRAALTAFAARVRSAAAAAGSSTAWARLRAALAAVGSAALKAAVIIGGALRRALDRARRAAGDLAVAIAKFALKWGPVIAVAIALGNALANLLPLVMLLAPAIFAAGAALAVLKFGFEGVGTALSAGLSGDIEEFREALKKLAPSAQEFVKALVKIAPLWRSLKKEIQQRLFVGLAKDIQALSAATFPTLTRWLTIIASEFNKFFSSVFKGLSTPEAQQQLNTIFAGVAKFIDATLDALKHLGRAFLDIAEVAAPAFGQLGDDIEGAAESFAGWIRKLKEDGTLAKWIEDAKETFGQLKDIGAEIGRIFAAIFKGTDEGGFLENLKNSLSELADFLEGEDGQAMIEFFSDVAKGAAGLIRTIGDVVRWFQEGFDKLRELGNDIKGSLSGVFGAIGLAASALFAVVSGGVNAFAWIGNILGRLDGLVGAVRNAASAINAALSSIRTSVVIDIITRNSVQGVARPIGGGGGGGRIVARAHGGPVSAGVPYVVGDAGKPEIFVPNQNGRVVARVPTGPATTPSWSGSMTGLEALFFRWFQESIRDGKLKLA